jgi:hypothetical protein
MHIVGEIYFMRVGNSYWMRSSFMHTVTELCFGARMEYFEGYFRASLLTQLIIQKSRFFCFIFIEILTFHQGFDSDHQRYGSLSMSAVSHAESLVRSRWLVQRHARSRRYP